MFREMRRKRQQLSEKEAAAVLERGTSGVLAVLGDGGYPYAVPLSYVYQDGKIYFHCAGSGHKLDGIRNCDKVSFCVIDQDEVHPEKYTTYFRSVIAFGKARILEEDEKRKAILLLTEKYCPKEGHREGVEAPLHGGDPGGAYDGQTGHRDGKIKKIPALPEISQKAGAF